MWEWKIIQGNFGQPESENNISKINSISNWSSRDDVKNYIDSLRITEKGSIKENILWTTKNKSSSSHPWIVLIENLICHIAHINNIQATNQHIQFSHTPQKPIDWQRYTSYNGMGRSPNLDTIFDKMNQLAQYQVKSLFIKLEEFDLTNYSINKDWENIVLTSKNQVNSQIESYLDTLNAKTSWEETNSNIKKTSSELNDNLSSKIILQLPKNLDEIIENI